MEERPIPCDAAGAVHSKLRPPVKAGAAWCVVKKQWSDDRDWFSQGGRMKMERMNEQNPSPALLGESVLSLFLLRGVPLLQPSAGAHQV
jgi:hypothetical protein